MTWKERKGRNKQGSDLIELGLTYVEGNGEFDFWWFMTFLGQLLRIFGEIKGYFWKFWTSLEKLPKGRVFCHLFKKSDFCLHVASEATPHPLRFSIYDTNCIWHHLPRVELSASPQLKTKLPQANFSSLKFRKEQWLGHESNLAQIARLSSAQKDVERWTISQLYLVSGKHNRPRPVDDLPGTGRLLTQSHNHG